MLLQIIIFLLPAACGRIEINVIASTDTKTSRLQFSGENVDIISDKDIEAFNFTKDVINKGLFKSNKGVYHSPTPWGDLYVTHHWKQVKKHLIPQNATILSLDSNTLVLLSDVFDDTNKDIDNFLSQIPRKIENTITSLWNKKKDLSAGKEIIYRFTMNVPDMMGSEEFVYLWKWGRNVEKREELVAGLQTPMNVTLSPNRTVVAKLLIEKSVMKIMVEYKAFLSGQIALNYGVKPFNGHYFYAMWKKRVVELLKYLKLPTNISSSEVVELVYYYDCRVVFRDRDAEDIIYTASLDAV